MVKNFRLHAFTRPILVLSLLSTALTVTQFEFVHRSRSMKNHVQACIGTNLVGQFAYSNDYAGGALMTVAVVNVERLRVGLEVTQNYWVFVEGMNTHLRTSNTARKAQVFDLQFSRLVRVARSSST